MQRMRVWGSRLTSRCDARSGTVAAKLMWPPPWLCVLMQLRCDVADPARLATGDGTAAVAAVTSRAAAAATAATLCCDSVLCRAPRRSPAAAASAEHSSRSLHCTI